MTQLITQEDYPHLFSEVVMSNGNIRGYKTSPQPELISNVNLVPYIGEKWVIIKLANQLWEITGGRVEPNEHYLDTIPDGSFPEVDFSDKTSHEISGNLLYYTYRMLGMDILALRICIGTSQYFQSRNRTEDGIRSRLV